jgi:hypothetical protein
MDIQQKGAALEPPLFAAVAPGDQPPCKATLPKAVENRDTHIRKIYHTTKKIRLDLMLEFFQGFGGSARQTVSPRRVAAAIARLINPEFQRNND